MKEIERVFGEEKIRGLFFRGHVAEAQTPVVSKSDPAGKQPS